MHAADEHRSRLHRRNARLGGWHADKLFPLTTMHWFIWGLAATGKFFEGMVVFMTGVALPLMVNQFGLGATEKGVIAAAVLLGIMIGATALGRLADRYGRKQMFVIEMILFAVFIALLTLSPSYPVVVVALVGIGIALGCDYPTAHLIISESVPSRSRGRMVLAAFGFQAVGAMAGTAVGFVILYENPEIGAWRWMYASTLLIALPVILGRFFVTQSPYWLVVQERFDDAEAEIKRLLHREPQHQRKSFCSARRRDAKAPLTLARRRRDGPASSRDKTSTGPSLPRFLGFCRT